MIKFARLSILFLCFQAIGAVAELSSVRLKSGFVYLDVLDPSIRVDIRYATQDNLTGRPLPGMETGRAVLTREAAMALVEVQEDLILHGYVLVIYNAYMPLKAFKTLEEWSESDDYVKTKDRFCPNFEGAELKEAGYISDKQDFVRGSAVAATIIPIHSRLKHTHFYKKKSLFGSRNRFMFVDDGTADMGTSFDFLDPISCHSYDGLHEDVMNNRQLLRETMENHGFKPNNKVWWQYTYLREPYMDSEFNFDI